MTRLTQGCVKTLLALVVAAAVGLPLRLRAAPPGNEPTSHPASAASSTAPASKPAAEFTLATFNINYGNPDLKSVVETIRKADADLVAVQEVNEQSANLFRNALGKLYPHMQFRFAPAAGGFAFLSKRPLLKLQYHPPSFGWFGFWLAQVELGGKTLHVGNVHLLPTIPQAGDGVAELMKRFLATEPIRFREIEHVFGKLPKGDPVVLLGDFNSTVQMAAPQYLIQRGFADSFAAVNEKADRQASWHWKIKEVDWRLRIDYIFHTAHFRTLSSRILETAASDHFLVVSRLTWKPTTASEPAAATAGASAAPR